MNLRHLRAVKAIVDTGTISAAAKGVSLTQPAITQAIAKLESQLDIRLFERTPAGMIATDAGRILAFRSARALAFVGSGRVTASQARALVALARHGSYAAAATALSMHEPSLHRSVKDLSLALAQKVVERRGRRVALTARGAALARRFSLAQTELDSAVAEIDGLRGREVGRIAIGAMPLSRAKLLPDTIAKFHQLYPNVDIAIVEGSHAELLGPLRDGEIDLMIGALRSSLPSDLEEHRLFVDRPIVVGRAGHPLTQSRIRPRAEQLASFSWIVPPAPTPLRTQWARIFESSGIEPPRVAIECGSVLVIRQLLMSGDHLTLLSPAQVAAELEAGWLVKVCAAPGEPMRTIGVTQRAEWRPTRLQQVFLDLLQNQAKVIQTADS